MKLFDGSNNITILKSLANIFDMDERKFKNSIKKYYQVNKNRLDNINSYYDEFIEFLELEDDIQVDYVYFFHITSSIDLLKSIEKFGILDLRESLTKETAFKRYLQDQGICFHLNDGIELINKNKRIELDRFNSDECEDEDYWRNFHGEYLYHRLNFDYNVNGFLFKINVYKDSSYLDLKNKSEFLNHLGDFLNNKEICFGWENNKKSYILKCKIDVAKATLGNGLTWPTKHETSRNIINIALNYMIELEQNKRELPPITYVLINYGISIPFRDLEVLNYNINFEGEY